MNDLRSIFAKSVERLKFFLSWQRNRRDSSQNYEFDDLKPWIVVTYSIPREEYIIRKRVLRTLMRLGMVKFSDSFYYMPYSEAKMREVISEINDVEYINVFQIYTREVSDIDLARIYEEGVLKAVEGIEKRISSAHELIERGKIRKANYLYQKIRLLYRNASIAAGHLENIEIPNMLNSAAHRIIELKESLGLRRNEGQLILLLNQLPEQVQFSMKRGKQRFNY